MLSLFLLNLKETITNIINKFLRHLNEFAFSKSDAENKITGLGLPLMDHLIKILKWKDHPNPKDTLEWLSDEDRYGKLDIRMSNEEVLDILPIIYHKISIEMVGNHFPSIYPIIEKYI